MMNVQRFRNFSLNLALVAAVSAPLAFSAASGLVLASAKSVAVNNVNGISGATLKVGDVLTTGAAGSAAVTVGASRLTVGHITRAALETSAVRLDAGYVRVNGSLSVRHLGYAAVPATAKTDYEMVSLPNGKNYVRVYTGSVQLTGFAKPTTVAAGSAVSFDAPQAPAAASAGASGSAVAVPVAIGIVAAVTVAIAVVAEQSVTTASSPSQL